MISELYNSYVDPGVLPETVHLSSKSDYNFSSAVLQVVIYCTLHAQWSLQSCNTPCSYRGNNRLRNVTCFEASFLNYLRTTSYYEAQNPLKNGTKHRLRNVTCFEVSFLNYLRTTSYYEASFTVHSCTS